jgi:hypothetical protein
MNTQTLENHALSFIFAGSALGAIVGFMVYQLIELVV